MSQLQDSETSFLAVNSWSLEDYIFSYDNKHYILHGQSTSTSWLHGLQLIHLKENIW